MMHHCYDTHSQNIMVVQNNTAQNIEEEVTPPPSQEENKSTGEQVFPEPTSEEPSSTTPDQLVARSMSGMNTDGDRALIGGNPISMLGDVLIDLYLAEYGDELPPEFRLELAEGQFQQDFIDGFEAGFVLGFGGSLEHTDHSGSDVIANPDDAFSIDMNDDMYGIGESAVEGWDSLKWLSGLITDNPAHVGIYKENIVDVVRTEFQAFNDDPLGYAINFLETTDQEIIAGAGLDDIDVEQLKSEQQRILNDNTLTEEQKKDALMGVAIGAGIILIGAAIGYGIALALQSEVDLEVDAVTEALELGDVGKALLNGESVADAAPEVVNEALNKFGINPDFVGEGKLFATPQKAVATFMEARAGVKARWPEGVAFDETAFRDYYKAGLDRYAASTEPVVGGGNSDPLLGNPLEGTQTSDEISSQIASDYYMDTEPEAQMLLDAEVELATGTEVDGVLSIANGTETTGHLRGVNI
jgi:hypothetical protein